jgi:hypothetical protein
MDNCPKCKVSFRGDPIPDIDRPYFAGSHWRREIGIDGGYIGIYDGIVAMRCPDCKHEFPRNNSKWALDLFDKYVRYCKGEEFNNDVFKLPRSK